MKHSISILSLLALVSFLAFYGCTPDNPQGPEETEFLLTKIYTMPYKPTDTPYVKEEYKYNKRNKPWISVELNSAGDTLAVYEYFYDNNDRLTERHYTYGSLIPSPGRIERYYYDSLERISRIEEERSSVGRVLQTYAYGPSSVLQTFKFIDAGTEFKRSYVVERATGNYIKLIAQVVIGQAYTVEWGGFDNSPNAFSFTHIKTSLFDDAGFRVSNNNPGWTRTQNGGQVTYQQFINTYNEDNMLIRRQSGTYSVDSFQYIKVKKVN